MRCLKRQRDAEVHFLTKASFSSFLVTNPHIDKVWTIQKRVGEVLGELRREGFDAVVDLHHNLRSWQVRRGLRVPSRRFNKLNWQKWLLVNLKIDRLPRVHIVDRYMEAAAWLGIRNDGEGLDFFIPPEAEVRISDHIAGKGQNFGAFAIGAAHATKRLPAERIREICATVRMPLALLGGPGDVEAGEIAAQAGSHVHNLCGKLSVNQSASVIRQAAWVISHDTGMMHIAAALRKPIISIWGSTVPAFGMYPYLPENAPPESRVEVKGLSCRPCSKIGYDRCPRGHFRCMQEIFPAEILTRLPPILSPK